MALIYRSVFEVEAEAFVDEAHSSFGDWLRTKRLPEVEVPVDGEIVKLDEGFEIRAIRGADQGSEGYRAHLFERRDDESVRTTFTAIDDGTTPTSTRPLPGTATTTVARPPATTITSVATTVPRATTTVPRATTTVPVATSTTAVPSTTVAPSSTTVPSSTTTTRPDDPGHGVLSGGILRTDPVSGAEVPVGGVRVVATNLLESVEATSGPDGRWRFPALEPGYYLVIAHVPSQYRPRDGLYERLASFDRATTGAFPEDDVVASEDGSRLYGLTQAGGVHDPEASRYFGTVFALDVPDDR